MGSSLRTGYCCKFRVNSASACLVIPEVVNHVGYTEERQDKGTGPAVTLPDEVAARVSGLAQAFLSNCSV